ncbi:expressed unknown protein [Seminavis robusta]|uniref:Uncharacterized protein n=1 Tax=Seminavis robusta TaxID=568900 RepID=A0A9N8DHL4_9STRA|nr:expressed unknown protein [Seminavis robusta]|eukprot:Sro132_g062511.1  (132) ;mRNA; f:37631-38026
MYLVGKLPSSKDKQHSIPFDSTARALCPDGLDPESHAGPPPHPASTCRGMDQSRCQGHGIPNSNGLQKKQSFVPGIMGSPLKKNDAVYCAKFFSSSMTNPPKSLPYSGKTTVESSVRHSRKIATDRGPEFL